jgi:hypothetical protein
LDLDEIQIETFTPEIKAELGTLTSLKAVWFLRKI